MGACCSGACKVTSAVDHENHMYSRFAFAYLLIMEAKYTASIMSFDLTAKEVSSSSTLRFGSRLNTSCKTTRQTIADVEE